MYDTFEPSLPLGLPFTPATVGDSWYDWPALPDLFSTFFSGANTNRDPFLVDIDRDRLEIRLGDYFNPALSHDEIARRYPLVMKLLAYFDAAGTRETLLRRGGPTLGGFIEFTYRPFDTRWLYWEADTKLLNDKRADYLSHVFEGNMWLSAAKHLRKDPTEPQACLAKNLSSLHLIERGANMFPAWLRETGIEASMGGAQRRPNLSDGGATLPGPPWPGRGGPVPPRPRRPPRPLLPEGQRRRPQDGVASHPAAGLAGRRYAGSRGRAGGIGGAGRELAALLDSDTPVPGVTTGALRPEMAAIAVPSTTDGGNMAADDFSLTAGWGHFGQGEAVMPGQGRVDKRPFTAGERAALGSAADTLGNTTFDIHLNDRAYWRNVPAAVWSYKLGGYQVLKKWLSYRERGVLGRALRPDEVQHFTDASRRIAGILGLVGEG